MHVAADYATGVSQRFGERSLEYIEASAFWLDMLARQIAAVGGVDVECADAVKTLRFLIKDEVSADVWPVFEQYFNDFLV